MKSKLKKMLCLLVVVLLISTSVAVASTNSNTAYGDLDNNGVIYTVDALMILHYTVGKITFIDTQKLQGDVTGEGEISAIDALTVLHYVVSKIKKFPVENKDTSTQSMHLQILELVNAERQKNGVKPLQYYYEAQYAADIRTEEIVMLFSHTRPNNTSCFTVLEDVPWMSVGENIAKGYSTPKQVMDAWMNSTGHRENILSSSYTHLIVGYDYDTNAWVQLFLRI